MQFRKEMSKSEIESALASMGDFVQIDNLTRFLKEDLALDKKKFVVLKLAEIYERRNMFAEAAKMFNSAGIWAMAFSEKINYYVKEAEMFIKAGLFERADEATKKAYSQSNAKERQEVTNTIKDFYMRQAKVYEKETRRGNATRIYEKLLEMNISDSERREIKQRLLELYENLGRVKEYLVLKSSIEKG